VARHNVVAAFRDRRAADAAVERLIQNGVEASTISTNARTDAAIVADAEMRAEADSLVGGPGLVATESQSKGSLGGIALGAVVGGLLGLGIGALLFSQLGMILTTATGLVGGATVGGVVGGFLRPQAKEGPRRSLQGYQTTVGVHGNATEVARAEELLREADPIQLRSFGPDDEGFQIPLTTDPPAQDRGAQGDPGNP
jgi:hypothetical protein